MQRELRLHDDVAGTAFAGYVAADDVAAAIVEIEDRRAKPGATVVIGVKEIDAIGAEPVGIENRRGRQVPVAPLRFSRSDGDRGIEREARLRDVTRQLGAFDRL